MRTKALFLAAVFGVAGLATSFAQVYSVNAVGYINLTLKPGFQMIANQLDNGQGNAVGSVLSAGLPPDQAILYKWNGAGYTLNAFEDQGDGTGAWADPTMTLAPGEGAFLRLGGAANATVTLVGEVPQGNLSVAMGTGFSMISSIVPQAVALDDVAVNFPAGLAIVYRWNTTSQAYDLFTFEEGVWDPSVPTVPVGESFFVRRNDAVSWTRTFSVN